MADTNEKLPESVKFVEIKSEEVIQSYDDGNVKFKLNSKAALMQVSNEQRRYLWKPFMTVEKTRASSNVRMTMTISHM